MTALDTSWGYIDIYLWISIYILLVIGTDRRSSRRITILCLSARTLHHYFSGELRFTRVGLRRDRTRVVASAG